MSVSFSFAFLVLIVVIFGVVLSRSIRIVPQASAGIVERLGRYHRTLGAGLAIIIPFIDRLRPLIDLRERVVSFPPQPVITEDNLVVSIDSCTLGGGSIALISTRLTFTPHLPVASSKTILKAVLMESLEVSAASKSRPPTTFLKVVTASCSIP